jgi:hypothetical protein
MAFLTRQQLGPFLRSHGFPIGNSTAERSVLPSINTGPPSAGYFGRTQIWDDQATLEWAKANLSPEAKSFKIDKPRALRPYRSRKKASASARRGSLHPGNSIIARKPGKPPLPP